MASKLFGMVSTRASRKYTEHALRSFAAHTVLDDGDEFWLIDNDGSLERGESEGTVPRCRFIQNPVPRSFGENMNAVLAGAAARRADTSLRPACRTTA